jgi:YfiH family protein
MSMPVETIISDELPVPAASAGGEILSVAPAVAGGSADDPERQILTDAGFYWRERGSVKVLVCKPLEDAGFANGFSTRLGGVSDFPDGSLNLAGFDEDPAENIYENRKRFLNVFDGEFDLATAWQVHGDGVKVVRSQDDVRNSEERFDALVSAREGTLVGVKTADCVPILIGDPVTRSFAAVHSGWKGTAAKIAANAVEKMKSEFGADPRKMIVAIGPCASGKNYEVGSDVIERFSTARPDHQKYFSETRPGHALVDLRLANSDILTGAGISTENIFTAPFCTIVRTDLFFSYRVEKKKFGKTGRLLSVIGLAGA